MKDSYNTFINDDFSRSVKRLRSILPKLSFGLLIATYLISAIIMGIFHAQNAPNIGFIIAAFLVPLAIQTGRGTLVFFFQLNPAHIQGRFSFGIVAATVLLLLSIAEACLVLYPYGISWIVSVCTLMLIGWVIEIMILRETIFSTQMELFQDQERWQQVRQFYTAKNDLNNFIKGIGSEQSEEIKSLPEPEAEQPEPSEEEKELAKLLSELKGLLEGNA
ncbi:hypothetical protein [Phaeodactylibacter sp.]|uniref:hypothetical protein n=1 Tax=Phaeodactylibacter sp. TaxID=1940289 RepID=UPI0025FB4F1C|nr:hypothetical protein [Phaeodactylibacter sp.]MCI4649638.1 hypothetical protein [Phaeodactylibacter sp.]MCI5092671.1 hypothetical protein [Phaeodactylibacter sp.]